MASASRPGLYSCEVETSRIGVDMLTMAEPKRNKKAAGKAPRGRREIIINFKGYPEFKTWVQAMATEMRLPVSVLLEHALVEFARNHDFGQEPPER